MSLESRVDEVELSVFGNEKTKQKGLVERVEKLEDVAKELREFKVLARGVAIGLGLNLVAVIAGVAAILRELQ